MKKKNIVALAIVFWLLPLLATNVALAKNERGKVKNSKAGDVKVEMELELQPAEGVGLSGVSGEVEYKGKSGGKVNREKFKAAVKIPGESLGVVDWDSAQSAQLELRLYRGGSETPYSMCSFGLHEFEQEFKSGVLATTLEYRIDLDILAKTDGSWRFKKKAGTCDLVNPDAGFSVTDGVPAVQGNDLVLVVFVAPATDTSPSSEKQLLWGFVESN